MLCRAKSHYFCGNLSWNMPQLSVVIITLNEEVNIGRCLASVKGLADEVVVLDSFSTDRTEAICREYGALFHQHAFDDFVAQKNRALALASHDLVLSLDADEALSDELRRSILTVKDDPQAAGYTMNRLTNYCGKWIRHCGWYPDRKLRLVNRTVSRWEGKSIHEKMAVNGTVGHLEGDLLHFSYYSIRGHMDQANRFTDYSASAMFETGKRAPLWRLIVNPAMMFLRSYFLKLGFLDGFYGFVICLNSSHATFLKYAKLRQKWIEAGTPDA